jgi:RNA polymerase sigma-70 factor (ECF subfamily)
MAAIRRSRENSASIGRAVSMADPVHLSAWRGGAFPGCALARPRCDNEPVANRPGTDRSTQAHDGDLRDTIAVIYRAESRRVLATLIRLVGDFDLAEEAMHDAFGAALEQWPRDGVPARPRAWLVSVGRFKAIDRIRRGSKLELNADVPDAIEPPVDPTETGDDAAVDDDRLRLIFTCCHPALAADAKVALTLREMCGLTTEQIAAAFLIQPQTLAQRIVRAKAKIRDARIPYRVPSSRELPERLEAVLRVVYLVFNEGYVTSQGDDLTRPDLAAEAIRLGRLLVELLPDPEAVGLLALMLLHDSRRAARSTPTGDIVLLEDQDRSRWDRGQIAEGVALVERALASRRIGSYSLQAAIAAVHAEATAAAATDWPQIVGLYDVLLRLEPSPVVELNLAVAIAMRDVPKAGLERIDAILERGELADYALAHAARADLLRRMDRRDAARKAYRRAIELIPRGPQRRFLERRLDEL